MYEIGPTELIGPGVVAADVEHITWWSTVASDLQKCWSAQRWGEIHGKEGVAGSIPAGGSAQALTSGNAGGVAVRSCWGRPHPRWNGRQMVSSPPER